MNSTALYTKNNGLTVDEFTEQLKNTNLIEPEIVLARNCKMFPETAAVTKIQQFRKNVRFHQPYQPLDTSQQLFKMQLTNMTIQHIVEGHSSKFDQLTERIDKVIGYVEPKKRVTNKTLILRDPVPKTLLEKIMKASKPKGCHQATWALFQYISVLLFFTGLRAIEVASINKKIIEDILENGTLTSFQSKVNKFRKVRFTSHGINALKDNNKDILFSDNSVLYNIENAKSEKAKKFTRSINKYLNLINTDNDLKLSSHSFRVGFVTNSLKHTTCPLHIRPRPL